MRKKIIAGNWKMNCTPEQGVKLVNELKPLVANSNHDVIVGVPFVDLVDVTKALKGSNIKVAAQNVYFEDSGAYTGEVSAPMLVEIGVEYCIIGHSERRQYFGETDETVNKKAKQLFKYGITPIVCVGETLEQREAGICADLLRLQTKKALLGLTEEQLKATVIAYEPIWAIGTGKTATSEEAQEACKIIRDEVKAVYGEAVSEALRVQYGGSVKSSNASEILNKPDVDGALVGGASLKADEFSKIVNF